jgi:outer membrane lipoprotein-sorting protein
MKMVKLIAIAAIACLFIFSCGTDYGEDEGLVAKWYRSQASAAAENVSSLAFEFKNGTVVFSGEALTKMDYKVKGDDIITFLSNGDEDGRITFEVNDKKLILSNPTGGTSLGAGTYYKK